MKKYIIFGRNYIDCIYLCEKLKIKKSDCVFHIGKIDDNKIRGYYNYVVDDKVKIIGETKEFFF